MSALDPNVARRALKARLRGRERLFAAWTSFAHPGVTEIFTRAGVDFIGIDVEHGTFSIEQCRDVIAAAQAGGAPCLPRIASHDAEPIKRLLDAGADGLIAPMVETPEAAARIVSLMRYPPAGARSFGVARAQGYGFDFAAYTTGWNDSASFIAQIESQRGVENVEAILAVDGVDGVMVGPYDLSGSLGIPGQINAPAVRMASARVADAAKAAGRACGSQIVELTAERVDQTAADGTTFIVLSSDVFLLAEWSKAARALIAARRD
ncbi:MAG: aldolase/citrate lyase family protein [Pseudomonadota bacterium]